MYPDQYFEYYENSAETYYEDDCYNEPFDDNGWQTEESSQHENPAIWAQLWVLLYNTHQEQKDQADALVRLQASLDKLEESWKCSPPSPEPEVSNFYTNDNVCELASPEYVMEGHALWENQETIEVVENIVEEEVVGDNATFNSTAFDDFDIFENVYNVDLVMCESVPSPDDLIDEDVVDEAVSDSTDPSPTTPEIIEVFDTIGEGDQTSRSLLVPIHLLDDDQEVDADELIFENNKHNFITTHDPFMNRKLDVINTIDEDIWKHPDMLPSDPTRSENLYWHCKPKLQPKDSMPDTSKRGVKQLKEAALGTLHVKPLTLKRCRRKDRAWRFKATSKHFRRQQQLGSNRRTDKPFDLGKFANSGSTKGRCGPRQVWGRVKNLEIFDDRAAVCSYVRRGIVNQPDAQGLIWEHEHRGLFICAPRESIGRFSSILRLKFEMEFGIGNSRSPRRALALGPRRSAARKKRT
ncbi:hypothetical protein L1887_42002 [Cichorium endivia]|nr:hypothetical protein L1887_42002 [Cichorium endivia]